MPGEHPIPPAYWVQILDFLREDRTGQIVLHVWRGEVVGIDCTAMTRDRDLTSEPRPS